MLAINLNADIDPIFITVVGLSLATIIAVCVRWAVKTANTLIKGQAIIHEQVLGRTETKQQPAIPSLKEHFDTIDDKFDKVDQRFDAQDIALGNLEHEVTTNNGTSVKDAVKRIEGSLASHMEAEGEVLTRLETKLDKHMLDTAAEDEKPKETVEQTVTRKVTRTRKGAKPSV